MEVSKQKKVILSLSILVFITTGIAYFSGNYWPLLIIDGLCLLTYLLVFLKDIKYMFVGAAGILLVWVAIDYVRQGMDVGVLMVSALILLIFYRHHLKLTKDEKFARKKAKKEEIEKNSQMNRRKKKKK